MLRGYDMAGEAGHRFPARRHFDTPHTALLTQMRSQARLHRQRSTAQVWRDNYLTIRGRLELLLTGQRPLLHATMHWSPALTMPVFATQFTVTAAFLCRQYMAQVNIDTAAAHDHSWLSCLHRRGQSLIRRRRCTMMTISTALHGILLASRTGNIRHLKYGNTVLRVDQPPPCCLWNKSYITAAGVTARAHSRLKRRDDSAYALPAIDGEPPFAEMGQR